VTELVIVVGLAALAIAVALALLARRDDDDLVRVWSRLVSPSGRRSRETVDLQFAAQEQLLNARHALAAEATSSGTPLEAARLTELEREARAQRRVLVILRRMLSALNPR
jgi:hypothetical protein